MVVGRIQTLVALGLLSTASAFTPASNAFSVAPGRTVIPRASKLSLSKETDAEKSSDENKAEHESYSLDISKTIYTSSLKSPKDSYIAFAEKGAANAKMAKRKIFHQSVLGGCYVGFGGLLSLCVAGNIGGIGAANPGLVKMAFAALFPVNLLLIITTGGQLFTGNSATVAAARYEGLVDNYELVRSWGLSLVGNVVGCGLMALAAWYVGCLTGGTADLLAKTAVGKCGGTVMQNFVKAIMCNWMVSLAVFLSGASNDLAGKLVGVWFPISTFVAIGLEHSVANMFLMPAALLLNLPLTLGDVILKNILPVLAGNAIAGAIVVAASYSYQFGRLGGKQRAIFAEKLAAYEQKKKDLKKKLEAMKNKAQEVNGATATPRLNNS